MTRDKKQKQQVPEGVFRWHIRWSTALVLLAVHILALASGVPWLFSWSGLILMLVGFYAFGTLGINLCFHRLLTHRSFTCSKWLERGLTLLGLCNLQGSSIRWIAAHRVHHQHSDERPDPHSPLIDFLWSHMGWLVVMNPGLHNRSAQGRYAGDLCRDPFHLKLEKRSHWLWVWIIHVLLLWTAGLLIGWISTGRSMAGVQLGLSWLVWGVMLRTVFVWHITWSINSLTHMWGYRNYETTDNSRNNWLLGYIGMGEGWHNNHHADQRSAPHGHRWWELDLTYLTIVLLERLGLVSNVIRPTRHVGTRHDLRRKLARPAIQTPEPCPDP